MLEYIIYAIIVAALVIWIANGGIGMLFDRDDKTLSKEQVDAIKKIVDKK